MSLVCEGVSAFVASGIIGEFAVERVFENGELSFESGE